MPQLGLVLQLHHPSHSPGLVVDVDGAHHLLPLEVPDPEEDLGDAVAAYQLGCIRAGGELGVYFQAAQLGVAEPNLWIIAHQARVSLQVVTSEVNQLGQVVVDGGVGMVCQQLILHP